MLVCIEGAASSIGETFVTPVSLTTALTFWLRVPLFDAPFPCPTRSNEGKACNAEMDVFGDHAACCHHGPSLLFRHNNVRDILGHAARHCLSSFAEKIS